MCHWWCFGVLHSAPIFPIGLIFPHVVLQRVTFGNTQVMSRDSGTYCRYFKIIQFFPCVICPLSSLSLRHLKQVLKTIPIYKQFSDHRLLQLGKHVQQSLPRPLIPWASSDWPPLFIPAPSFKNEVTSQEFKGDHATIWELAFHGETPSNVTASIIIVWIDDLYTVATKFLAIWKLYYR